ncbi:MAG: NFACT RNA binding domain-containing protein [Bacteroidetes bacterium]|nr:NFACT RNA binding domain-containing protein [Bacteroidota bacterium]
MVNNYYTFYSLIQEVRNDIIGKTFVQIYSQEPNVLTLSFGDCKWSFLVSCEPSRNYLVVKKGVVRAKRNTADLFPAAVGKKLAHIDIAIGSREIILFLTDGYSLSIQLFGPKANVVLIDTKSVIIDAFLHKKDYRNTLRKNPEVLGNIVPHVSITMEHFMSNATVSHCIKQAIPMFSSELIREALYRSGINETSIARDLTQQDSQRLIIVLNELQDELLRKGTPRIYFQNCVPVMFSLITMHHLESDDFRCQVFDSVGEGIRTFLQHSQKQAQRENEYQTLYRLLTKRIKQNERALETLHSQRSSVISPEHYEQCGTLLLTALSTFSKGDSEVTVVNPLTQEYVRIPLEPQLSPPKNAERYFQKARKARKTIKEIEERIKKIQQELEQLNKLKDLLSTTNDSKKFLQEHEREFRTLKLTYLATNQANEEKRVPFRVFTVTGGFRVFAGKSSENNDLLTMHYTAKDDLWFHAHGVGGSHVVLKVHSAKGAVSHKAIEEAARIAAYYSKLRKASMVPVTMCEGKYVRKPKGAPPGTVVIEREKTLFVEPGLPSIVEGKGEE